MAFDPDAYLATKTGGFNPDAYLASKGVDVPKGSPSKPREYSDEQLGLDSGPVKGKSVFGDISPSERLYNSGTAVNSAIDRYSFGALGAVGRLLGDPGGINEGIEGYRAANPVLSGVTDAPAYLAEGPVRALAEGVDRLVPQAASGIGKLARSATTGGIGAGGTAALQSAVHGDEPKQIAKNAGEATLGGVGLGTGLGLLGRAGTAVMGSRGGQARQFIEQHGGEVSPLSSGKGKPYEQMDVSGTTDADIGAQAASSAEKGLGMLNQEKKGVLRSLGGTMSRINASPEGQQPRDVSSLIPQIQDALGEIDIASATEGDLQGAMAKIAAKQKPGFNPDTDPYMLSEADLNKLRRRLDRSARTGTSNDAALGPLKNAANEARSMVDEGPYKDANARYAKESNSFRESRRLLGISERPRTPGEPKTAVDKVANLITRRGQNTVTAGKQEGDLAAFEQKHPEIGAELAKPGLLRKKADISFHVLPQRHGGLIDRTGSTVGAAATLDALASTMGHGHVSPAKLALGVAGGLTLQNLPAIQARMLYPGAKLAASGEAQKLIPLFAAARAAQGDHR